MLGMDYTLGPKRNPKICRDLEIRSVSSRIMTLGVQVKFKEGGGMGVATGTLETSYAS